MSRMGGGIIFFGVGEAKYHRRLESVSSKRELSASIQGVSALSHLSLPPSFPLQRLYPSVVCEHVCVCVCVCVEGVLVLLLEE